MGKRSGFERKERDFYPTPYAAVVPLLYHIPVNVKFSEPCAGDCELVKHLESTGALCNWMSDINPNHPCVWQDAFDLKSCEGEMFITNPPYDWKILNPLITHLSDIAPTWLLLPADMMHNKRMAPHIDRCDKIVSVGRVKWFGNQSGMENSAWYLFDADFTDDTLFFGRQL